MNEHKGADPFAHLKQRASERADRTVERLRAGLVALQASGRKITAESIKQATRDLEPGFAGLSFQVIRLSNSAMYGLGARGHARGEAIGRVGFNEIHQLVGREHERAVQPREQRRVVEVALAEHPRTRVGPPADFARLSIQYLHVVHHCTSGRAALQGACHRAQASKASRKPCG